MQDVYAVLAQILSQILHLTASSNELFHNYLPEYAQPILLKDGQTSDAEVLALNTRLRRKRQNGFCWKMTQTF